MWLISLPCAHCHFIYIAHKTRHARRAISMDDEMGFSNSRVTVTDRRRQLRRRRRVIVGVVLALLVVVPFCVIRAWPSRDPLQLLREDSAEFTKHAAFLTEPHVPSTWLPSVALPSDELLSGHLWSERLLATDVERLHARLQFVESSGDGASSSCCILPTLYGRNFRWLTVATGRHLVNPRLVTWEEWRAAQPSNWRTTLVGLADDGARRSTQSSYVPANYLMFDTRDTRTVIGRELPNYVWVKYVDPMATMREGRLVEHVDEFNGADAHCIQTMIMWMDGNAPVSYDEWVATPANVRV